MLLQDNIYKGKFKYFYANILQTIQFSSTANNSAILHLLYALVLRKELLKLSTWIMEQHLLLVSQLLDPITHTGYRVTIILELGTRAMEESAIDLGPSFAFSFMVVPILFSYAIVHLWTLSSLAWPPKGGKVTSFFIASIFNKDRWRPNQYLSPQFNHRPNTCDLWTFRNYLKGSNSDVAALRKYCCKLLHNDKYLESCSRTHMN